MENLYTFHVSGKTDVGRYRFHNEDDFTICSDIEKNKWFFNQEISHIGKLGCLLMVADGMGGAEAGEIASELVVTKVKDLFGSVQKVPLVAIDIFLKNIVLKCHHEVVDYIEGNSDIQEMGTTVSLVWILENKAHIAWIGDSRCYLYREETLTQVTNDHAPVWDLVLKGELSSEEARLHPDSNLISQYVGQLDEAPIPEYTCVNLKKRDKVLLCSDGLSSMLSDQHILDILKQESHPSMLCNELIDAANEAGGEDNITVVLWERLVKEKKWTVQETNLFELKKNHSLFLVIGLVLISLLVTAGILLKDFYKDEGISISILEESDDLIFEDSDSYQKPSPVFPDFSYFPSFDTLSPPLSPLTSNPIKLPKENLSALTEQQKSDFKDRISLFIGNKEKLRMQINAALIDSSMTDHTAYLQALEKRRNKLYLYLLDIAAFDNYSFDGFLTSDTILIDKTLQKAFQDYELIVEHFDSLKNTILPH